VRRSVAAAIVGVALVTGACSTPVYTSDAAVRDLERQSHLTHTQATCIVTAIRRHFSDEINSKQRANNLSALPADRLKLEIDDALATLREPNGPDELAARNAISRCAPGALR
jgi:hypothetical protein